MRSLRQPGPAQASRIDSVRGALVELRYELRPGLSLNDAVAGPLAEAGLTSASVQMRGVPLNPFRFVMPGPPDGPAHVAYFSAAVEPPGTSVVEFANATFGWSDGKPAIHCHAAWMQPDGQCRGGHILVKEAIVAAPVEAVARGFRGPAFETRPDPETGFTLFELGGSGDGPGIAARVKPNEDILTALETLAARHGVRDAVVHGSVGSLIGVSFADGSVVDDFATEVAVREGWVRDGVAALNVLAVDMKGTVHDGWLKRGENPVLITFDLVIA
jgi:predicted DNA-binding protein with PD1-like motif